MSPPDDRDPVDVLAEEFAERLRRGERPSVGAYAAAHPDHADQLRDLLPAVAQMEQLKRFRNVGQATTRQALPDRFGDFRIVRELGRGGMGVVFEAVQESLGRRVALKVLSAHVQMDSERRERFIREAKAAARLHHTNIVPVFGVGEHAGLPYFVMQLIPGQGLHAVIAAWRQGSAASPTAPVVHALEPTVVGDHSPPLANDLPQPAWELVEPIELPPEGLVYGDWSVVAEIGIQVAEALQYAHDKKVFHRDVKPANLLLDDRGQVWVADFGLAKIGDQNGLTPTGHILGTLQYLAPECLHGEADTRSDVYGLGATLYELLTLVPPFSGESPARLMKQLAEADPVPPRSINPAIPRDLETIVLTALAREPGQRYSSAKLLADDLRAFLEDRPIRARRMSWAGRGWRLCRRNPAVAVLSFCTMLALALATVVGWVGYAKTQHALDAEKVALKAEAEKRGEAVEASRKLEANLQLSLEVFAKVFDAAGGNESRPGPGNRPDGPPGEAEDKAAVLEAVLGFYDQFAEQNVTNPRLRFDAAKAHRRVGELHRRLGRDEKAIASARRAAAILDGLMTELPESEVRSELCLVYAQAPETAGWTEGQLRRVAEFGRGITAAPEMWSVGAVYYRLGRLREAAGDQSGAEAAYREAIERMVPTHNCGPRPARVLVEKAMTHQRLAAFRAAAGDWSAARRELEPAVDELRHLVGPGAPPGRFVRETLVGVCRQMAGILEQLGDRPGVDRYLGEAYRILNEPGGPPKGPNSGRDGPPPRPGGPKDFPPPPKR
jgi:serine/threonine protein kinase